MDGRQPDGNRVGRITLNGQVTEYPIPSANGSPINIAVGPDRNIWFTKAKADGTVYAFITGDTHWRLGDAKTITLRSVRAMGGRSHRVFGFRKG